MRRFYLTALLMATLIMQNAWAVTWGPTHCDDPSSSDWTDYANGCGEDGDLTYYDGNYGGDSYPIHLSFPQADSIAEDDSIIGFELKIKCYQADEFEIYAQYITDDVIGAARFLNMPASLGYIALGDSTDQWEMAPPYPPDFNGGNWKPRFKIWVEVRDYSKSPAYIDAATLKIWYIQKVDTALYAYVDSLSCDYGNVSSGIISPQSGDSIGGGANWLLKSNILSSNNAYARIGGDKIDSMIVRYFNTSFPSTVDITGIKFELEGFCLGATLTIKVGLTFDGVTSSHWQEVVVTDEENYCFVGDSLDTWGMSSPTDGWQVNYSTFGFLIRIKTAGSSAESLFVDHARATFWYGPEMDSILVYAGTGAGDADSVIFCVDTTQTAWPDIDTYSWRSAVPYVSESIIYDTMSIFDMEKDGWPLGAGEDTVRLTVYIKDNSNGYSDPIHTWTRFDASLIEGVSKMTALALTAVSSPDQWINVGGASKVASLNDAVDANYIYTVTQGHKQRFSVANNTTITSDDIIDSVRVVARVQRSGTGTNTMRWNQIMPGDPPTIVNGTTYTLTSSWVTIYHRCKTTTAPGRVGRWTAAQLDSLEIEVENVAEASARQHRCTKLYVEVYHTPCIDSSSYRLDDPDGAAPYKDDGSFGHNSSASFVLDGGEVTCGRIDNIIWEASFRFHNRKIPYGKTFGANKYIKVDSAWLSVTAALTSADSINTRLYGEDADSAISFSTDTAAWNGRTRTTAYVDWDITADWVLGSVYRSPDISNIIQEIVDRTGWKAGKSIVIFWQDDGTSGTTARQQIRSEDYADGPGAAVLNMWWHCENIAGAAVNYRRRATIIGGN